MNVVSVACERVEQDEWLSSHNKSMITAVLCTGRKGNQAVNWRSRLWGQSGTHFTIYGRLKAVLLNMRPGQVCQVLAHDWYWVAHRNQPIYSTFVIIVTTLPNQHYETICYLAKWQDRPLNTIEMSRFYYTLKLDGFSQLYPFDFDWHFI